MAATRLEGVLVCAAFGLTASSLNLFNKFLIKNYDFSSIFTLLVVQSVLIIFSVEALKLTQWKGPELSVSHFTRLFPLGMLYVLHISFGIYAISRLNVPMFVTMRKMTTILIYLWDIFLLGKKSDWMAGVGVLLITVGALVAGFNDLTGDFGGFCFAGVCNFLTAAYYQLSSALATKYHDIDSLTQGYYNGLIALPIVMVLMLALDEPLDLGTNPYFTRPSFSASVLGLCVVAVTNMFLATLCATVNSPMATTVTGNIKDVFTMTIGLFAFGDVILTPFFVAGLVISTLGALIYCYSRLRATTQPKIKPSSEIDV